MLKIKTILHPTDFSSCSDNAFHLAASLARDHGSRLILLHVRKPPETVIGEFGMVQPVDVDADADEKLKRITCDDASIRLERQMLEGNPAEAILAAARAAPCDMIVMGGHNGSRLGKWLMGSVSTRVMREADCPVLVVKLPFAQSYTVAFQR